eukprot:gene18611-862_t
MSGQTYLCLSAVFGGMARTRPIYGKREVPDSQPLDRDEYELD